MFKIGRSKNPFARLKELKTGCPVPIELIGFIRCRSHMHHIETERQLHEEYAGSRRGGEWFQLSNPAFCTLEKRMREGLQDHMDDIRAANIDARLNAEFKMRLEVHGT